jgi:hypothetical protein
VDILDAEGLACPQDGAQVVGLVKVLKDHRNVSHTPPQDLPETLQAVGGEKGLEMFTVTHD